MRVRTPFYGHRRQAGPLTGSPSKRQAMKLPNIFEKDATPIPFASGQIIFEEGQARDFMYVVKKGEIDIVIRGHVVETVGEDSFFRVGPNRSRSPQRHRYSQDRLRADQDR